ncbi:toast rack family protein [Chloroflexota bacterium]
MKKRYMIGGILLTITTVLLSTVACSLYRPQINVGPIQNESRSIERGGTDSVRAEIEIIAGHLKVAGGAADLLQADFTYNVTEVKPEVKHSGGTLSILTPDVEGKASLWDMDDYRNEWDLRFTNDVPMEMKILLGAGQADLELGDLTLTRLDIDTGTGEVTLDLHGASALTRLDLKAGVGEISVDLSGDWQNDLDADISGGVGEMTLVLPAAVCVRVDVQGGISNTNATGLTKDGDDYVNDACGQSNVTLRIDISAGIGNINLNLGD